MQRTTLDALSADAIRNLGLAPANVAVAILHPDMVETDTAGGHGEVEPGDAARGLLARLDELTPSTSGGFWHDGERLPW
jgi:hypothetical protein